MRQVPVEWCIGGRALSEPRLHPHGRWLGYLAGDGPVTALFVQPLDGGPVRQLTSHPAPRAARAMGGGVWDWLPHGDAVLDGGGMGVVYLAVDGRVWWQPAHGGPQPVTPATITGSIAGVSAARVGASDVVLFDVVLFDVVLFTVDDAEVWRARRPVAAEDAEWELSRLDDGHDDFVIDPWPLVDGSVQWIVWNVPSMPWDASAVVCRHPDGALTRTVPERTVPERTVPERTVPEHSVQQPRTDRLGRRWWVSDDDGWLRVHCDGHPVIDEPFEHAGPAWGSGQRSYAVSPDGAAVAFARNEDGFGRLCVADIATGEVREIGRGVHGQLSWCGDTLASLRSGARTPTELVTYDAADRRRNSWPRTAWAVSSVAGWDRIGLTEPERLAAPRRVGAGRVPTRLYRAEPASDRLLCWVHGGPTDQWQVTFMPRIAYWQSRGWNVVVPDHVGSTGHGREYQQALRGRWGIDDAADVIAVIRHAQQLGLGRPSTTFLLGGSAGGFTALCAAADLAGTDTGTDTGTDRGADHHTIAGVVAAYPVCDLADLAVHSHRFEAHYTDTLVAPPPALHELSQRRSPIHRAAELATTPLLVMHGDADPVVPVDQSRALVAAVRAAGGEVQLIEFAGEGHGVRDPVNQRREYDAVEQFLLTHTAAHG